MILPPNAQEETSSIFKFCIHKNFSTWFGNFWWMFVTYGNTDSKKFYIKLKKYRAYFFQLRFCIAECSINLRIFEEKLGWLFFLTFHLYRLWVIQPSSNRRQEAFTCFGGEKKCKILLNKQTYTFWHFDRYIVL